MPAEILRLIMLRQQKIKVAEKLEDEIDELAKMIEELEKHGDCTGSKSKAV